MSFARLYALILIALLSYSTNLFAQSSDSPPKNTSPLPPQTEPPSMDKYAWLTKMKTELSQQSCAENQYFMHCFDIEKSTCLALADHYLTACIDNLAANIPAQLSPKDAQHWGPILIFCSHDLFSHFMTEKKKTLPECEQQETIKTD